MAAPPTPDVVCGFDRVGLHFQGLPHAQARCLLRVIHPRGRVDAEQADVPSSLLRLIDQPMGRWKAPLRQYLMQMGRSEQELGGSLDAPLSMVTQDEGTPVQARYFVIHDTSWPWLDTREFPLETDEQLNDLSTYAHASTALAHVFVNRVGRTFTAHAFDEPWRATKLEMRMLGARVKGLFLHVELVQPRRRDLAGPIGNDTLAPTPGFTEAQYDTLALLYMAASVRGGIGLVPGLHGAVDDGLPDSHDDPQNFVLSEFGASLERLELRLSALVIAREAMQPQHP